MEGFYDSQRQSLVLLSNTSVFVTEIVIQSHAHDQKLNVIVAN